MDTPNLQHLVHILSKFGNKYIDQNNQLKRQDLLADVNNYNKALIKTLVSDPETNHAYFVHFNGVYVFKIDKFTQAVRDADYYKKSHTDYENHIGLAIDRHYLRDSSNVVLDFPHKDCVLQGGMTTEDTKHNVNERFYNDVISAPQIDNMFAPKVLCNVKKYDQNHLDGKTITKFDPNNDNLMIKANNLIALHSLLQNYAGKVKLIYIDPPYNTGNDSFKYNDRFNQSTWLVFMKNRLEVAKRLLSPHGSLWISIDSNESHYLKVLTDEIFGKENFVDEITWQRAYAPINLKKTVSRSTDSILIYAKNFDKNFSFNRLPRNASQNSRYKNPDHDSRGPWKSDNLSVGPAIKKNIYTITTPSGRKVTPPSGYSWRLSKPRFNQFKQHHRIWFGKNGNNVPSIKRFLSEVRGVVAQTLWLHKDVGDNQDGKRELKKLFGKNVFTTPKPEKLMQRIIHMATDKGDLVLDFFSGSATTQAVAMKMHRHFIGVEQMNYPISKSDPTDVYVKRLQKVIEGEQGGISKAVNWQGGGSFVFATFLNKNQKFIQLVQNAKDSDQLDHIYHQMKASADIRLDVDLKKYESKADNLPREKKRKCLIDMLDKNQLYYNYADIDDSNVRSMISDPDYQFNRSFYDGDDNK